MIAVVNARASMKYIVDSTKPAAAIKSRRYTVWLRAQVLAYDGL
jgi:hypothetical protein